MVAPIIYDGVSGRRRKREGLLTRWLLKMMCNENREN